MTCQRVIFAGLLLASAIGPAEAPADVAVFTDRDQFLAVAGPLSFEGFEDTGPGTTGSSRGLPGFILGPLNGNEDPGDPGFENLTIFDDPAVAAEGDQAVGGEVRNIGFFAFTDPNPTAFGFTILGFGDAGLPDTLRLILTGLGGGDTRIDLASSSDPFRESRFFGVISSDPFSTVQIRKGVAADFITVDAVSFGAAEPAAIPEPSSITLTGLTALVGLGYAWRRCKRASA